MRLFRRDQNERIEQFERCNLVRQKSAMKRMRLVLTENSSDVRFSATTVSGHQDLLVRQVNLKCKSDST